MENNPAEQPTQLQQPVQPVTPASQPSQTPPPSEPQGGLPLGKIALVIVGVLILLAVLGGGFLLVKGSSQKPTPTPTPIAVANPTPTPVDETANWQVYNSNGIYFKYPNTWKTIDLGIQKDVGSCIYIGESTSSPALAICSIEQKFSQVYPTVTSDNAYSKTEINGYLTYKRISETPTLNGDVYIVNSDESFVAFGKTDSSADKYLDKILSTFKFTNSTNETANWKTYNGQTYSLRYPNDWSTIETQDALTIYPSGYPFKAPGEPDPNSPYLKLSVVPAVGRGVEPIKQVNIMIDSQETVKYYESGTAGIIKAINTPDNRFLSVTFQLPQASNPAIDSQYDKILSTFKFTQ